MTTEQNNLLVEEPQLVDAKHSADLASPAQEEIHEILEEIDYRSWDKPTLIKAFQDATKSQQVLQALKKATKIKSALEEKLQEERQAALEKFQAEGGNEDDFEYKGDSQFHEIEKEYKALRNKQKEFLNDLTRKKQENYQARLVLLDKLRLLADGQKSLPFKQIQEEWKKASPIPQEHNEELWATFNALANRYYDNKNIDFELKELDRKKNLEAKLELCQKAEGLIQESSISKSLETLNHLHREYKHTGPVPEDQKETVWQRFKTASDALYARRDEYLQHKLAEQQVNLQKKKDFLLKLEPFSSFTSSNTEEWKLKLTELETLQKEWSTLGFSGKDEAGKEIGKKYWEYIKTFFRNKNDHYKKIYDQLTENLKKKEYLCEVAENLAQENDLDKAGKTVIDLQKKWKEAGHVPFKVRDKIYDRFKKACDNVFDRKRGVEKDKEGEYEQNLIQKLGICTQIASLDVTSKESQQLFRQLLAEWKTIGFVPKKDLAQVQSKYAEAVKSFLENGQQNEEEKRKIRLSLELEDLRSKPDAKNLLFKKEHGIKGKIKALQAEIDTLNNNLLFFSRSKNASSLAKEVEQKVQNIEKQIDQLKDELKLIQSA